MAFPTTILSLADAIGSQFLNLFWGGSVAHSTGINQIKADLIATETKLGTGASTASANTVLRGTGSGTTAFGQIVSADITDGTIVNADISAGAAIAYTKLALSSSIVSGDIVDGTLLNADINATAAIAVSKLAAGSANSVLTSNGSTDAFSATPTVTSLTTTGAVTSGGGLFANGAATISYRVLRDFVNSVNGTQYDLGVTPTGMLVVLNNSSGQCITIASAQSMAGVQGDTAGFTTGSDSGVTVRVYLSAGHLMIRNSSGSDKVLSVVAIGQ